EGSYTTHLFTKGPDKIRKKTGEEAVELILARSNEELLSEAADLIYHLMVLLEAEGLSITDVISVLHRRHQAG
ncbi:MAG: phosphoribosyl-ATP diphosphatase, partial [Alkalispirochaeta sp.]